jgi:parallel beta-helix repeat protein
MNTLDDVAVTGFASGNTISGNSTHDNQKLGIDLGSMEGVTANDDDDPDP